jgi:hypothetical protein
MTHAVRVQTGRGEIPQWAGRGGPKSTGWPTLPWLRYDPNVRVPDPVPCTVSMSYIFTGRISAADCSLIGSGVRTLQVDDSVNCIGMETSVGSFQEPLEATIDKGQIWGIAGGLSFSLDLVEHAG